MVARNDTIKFILGGLVKLNVIAHAKEEPPEEAKERKAKDSNK